MDRAYNEILQRAETIAAKIEKKQKLFPFVKLVKNPSLIKKCESLYMLQAITNKAIQVGNYKRAMQYLVVIQSILDELDKAENKIYDSITQFILEEY